MGRVMAVGVGMFVVMAIGGVASGGQAKPAAKPALTSAEAKALKNPVPADAVSIEAGKGTFAKYCRACHGPEGKGDGPGAALLKDVKVGNLSDNKWDHGSTDGEIFNTIAAGVGPRFIMAAFQGRIPDTQIWHLVNYIKTLSKTATK